MVRGVGDCCGLLNRRCTNDVVGDREFDIYVSSSRVPPASCNLIIRAAHHRRLADDEDLSTTPIGVDFGNQEVRVPPSDQATLDVSPA